MASLSNSVQRLPPGRCALACLSEGAELSLAVLEEGTEPGRSTELSVAGVSCCCTVLPVDVVFLS